MTFFRPFQKKTGKSDSAPRNAANKDALVKRSADTALKQYSKTFLDLAKYDRGESISLSR